MGEEDARIRNGGRQAGTQRGKAKQRRREQLHAASGAPNTTAAAAVRSRGVVSASGEGLKVLWRLHHRWKKGASIAIGGEEELRGQQQLLALPVFEPPRRCVRRQRVEHSTAE